MKAYNAQQLWLVTYTLQSTTLIEVDFDPILWDKIMSLAEKKYGIPKPVIPMRLHEESNDELHQDSLQTGVRGAIVKGRNGN